MHTGRRYRLIEILVWTRRDLLFMTLVASVPAILYFGFGWSWLEVPWVPVAMLGTASAFTVGFRNNATYARTWEARQVWGSIVNTSRSWAIMVRDVPGIGDDARTFVHRHIAWLTALRYQLRERRAWENVDRPDNKRFQERYFTIPERDGALATHLEHLLGAAEATEVTTHTNRATAVLAQQSAHLGRIAAASRIDSVQHMALLRQLESLFEHQGRCERIKNFPYPRQFATLNYWFIRLFVWVLPFGMWQEFRKLGDASAWLSIPFSILVAWIFLVLEKIGESTENPFEGSANDVPISTLSRTIEIDLRQLLGEADIPKPLEAQHTIFM